MSKAKIVMKYAVNANGILSILSDNTIGVEIEDTGEVVMLQDLLADFADKTVKLSVTYDEDYE